MQLVTKNPVGLGGRWGLNLFCNAMSSGDTILNSLKLARSLSVSASPAASSGQVKPVHSPIPRDAHQMRCG